MNVLNNINLYIAAVDIDGTLKDLVKENTNALINTLKRMDNIYLTKRGKLVLFINKFNMYFVKTGMLPTNRFMQNVLLFVYSLLVFKKYNLFKKIYFEEYNKQNIFFECANEMIEKLGDKDLFVYLVTKNRQNKRMLKLKDSFIVKNTNNLIIGRRHQLKYFVYKSFFTDKNIYNQEALIVGDNFWDDVLPSILLGTTIVWCNMYNSKLKRLAIKILKKVFKNIIDETELFIDNQIN